MEAACAPTPGDAPRAPVETTLLENWSRVQGMWGNEHWCGAKAGNADCGHDLTIIHEVSAAIDVLVKGHCGGFKWTNMGWQLRDDMTDNHADTAAA